MPEYRTKDADRLLELVNSVGGDRERCPKPVEFATNNDKARCMICVFKRTIHNNTFIQCAYNWPLGLQQARVNIIPLGSAHGIGMGFYTFPLLYDPKYMVIKCQAFNRVSDLQMALDGKKDAIVDMVAILQLIQSYALKGKESGGKDNEKRN